MVGGSSGRGSYKWTLKVHIDIYIYIYIHTYKTCAMMGPFCKGLYIYIYIYISRTEQPVN